jgi:adenylate kinase family enzyme
MNTRNILLIGRTGSGKSTLANVLMDENRFNVSAKSVSATKHIEEGIFEVDLDRGGREKVKYRVIDTIGLGDTNMTPQGVLMRLAEMAGRVKREGLNQILFVTKGRFTKEEIEAYDLLSSIIFDKNVIKYTTIVRTGFEDFEDEEMCEEDREALKMENEDLAHIIRRVRVVYFDKKQLKCRNAKKKKKNRDEKTKKFLKYL